MSVILAHARAETLQLARYPSYSLPTLAFPAVLLLLVGTRLDEEPERVLAGFAATAVLGVAFFQFGVGIAVTRATPWESYIRTLAVGPGTRLAARVLSALGFALVSAGIVVLVGTLATDVHLEPWRFAPLAAGLIVGGVPFALFGIALGYWLPPRAALPVANLLYLPLAVGGALWAKPNDISRAADVGSQLLPTRSWIEVVEPSVLGGGVPLRHVAALAGWTLVFVVAAWLGYRRDEGERFT